MYRILYSEKVLKELNELENQIYLKTRDKILSLEQEPMPVGSIKLTNQAGYRIRVGNYRILYEIDDKLKIVNLLKIGHRKNIYK